MQKAYVPSVYSEDRVALVEVLGQGFAQDIGAKFSFNRTTDRFSVTFRSTGYFKFAMSDDMQPSWVWNYPKK